MYSVVLVDDERLIVKGLSSVVPWAEMGCRVAGTAFDGVGGLKLIREIRPDIVLTDIRMPNMDGLTMLAALRSEYPRMQMSVLTAYRDFDYARHAINLGVCRYLLKPSDMNELEEAVRVMVSRLDAQPKEAAEASDTEGAAGNFIVQAALGYMRSHCTDGRISLSDVADHVYVSQWHLSKLLNRETGQSFFDLLGGMRIDLAKRLLSDPARRIHEVAEAVGYLDVAHFSKSFKKHVGCTPGEYRNGGCPADE
ncbi:MAG: response regulator [Clostridia bacterium]|nr:response regulator [Clostridia bacterium]